jgi:uncharacterized protein (TIGR04222 family)
MNVLDWTGPQFLSMFVPACVGAFVFALAVRHGLTGRFDWSGVKGMDLDSYEVAYLAGGPTLATQAAIASLVHANLLTVNPASQRLMKTNKKPDAHRPDLEHAVHHAVHDANGSSMQSIPPKVETALNALAAGPLEQGLLVPVGRRWPARLAPALPLAALALLGLAKIGVGISRHRPVGFLFFLCLLLVVATINFVRWRPWLTQRGRRVLNSLQDSSAALKSSARHAPANLNRQDLVLAVGLFGIGVLTAGPFADFPRLLGPMRRAVSGSWWSCSGSSSGSWSSCSGGSSCSGSSCGSSCGGGCGGGGCGGCGGG